MTDIVSPAAAAAWNDYVSEVRGGMARVAFGIMTAGKKITPCGRGQWKMLAHFRQEKTPSFHVYADGRYHDYGIGRGGDLITFVQERDGTNFRDTVDTIASEIGIPTWDERKKKIVGTGYVITDEQLTEMWESDEDKRAVFEVITAIVQLCHECLSHQVKEHLRNHYGLSADFIAFEKIGWVPEGLYHYASEQLRDKDGKPYTEERLLSSGFFRVGKEGVISPFMSQRILFPYWKDGVAVYTIGREFFGKATRKDAKLDEWDLGKYKKHATYRPSRKYISSWIQNDVFYGEDSLRGCHGDTVLITEGITDAMMLKQLGFRVISPVTIAYRDQDVEHAVKCLKSAGEVVIINDSDIKPDGKQPGLEGAKKMALQLHAAGIPVRIGRLPRPDGKDKTDVNELGREHLFDSPETPETEWRTDRAKAFFVGVIAEALGTIHFVIDEIPADSDIAAVEAALAEIGALAANMTEIRQSSIFNQFHKRFSKTLANKKLAEKAFFRAARTAQRAKEAEDNPVPGPGVTALGRALRGTLKGSVIPDLGFYDRETPSGLRERISNFGLTLKRVIVPADKSPERLACEVRGIDGDVIAEEWIVPDVCWVSKRGFTTHFPSRRMVWSGDDNEVGGVLSTLVENGAMSKVPNIRICESLGRWDTPDGPRFVVPAGVMSPSGWMAEPDITYLANGGSNLLQRLPLQQTDLGEGRELLKKVWDDLWISQEIDVITTMASWSIANYWQARFREQLHGFPHINVAAGAGSGKTSYVTSFLWRMFVGVKRRDAMSCTSTLFTFTRDFSSTNSLFLVLDEYKPSDMGERQTEILVRAVRKLYAGESESRGRGDQGMNVYHLTSGLMLLGEVRLDDDVAIRERSIYVPMSKNWVTRHKGGREAFARLSSQPLHLIAPFLQCWSLTADFDAILLQAEEETATALGEHRPTERIKKNLTIVVFGLLAMRRLAGELGLTMPATVPQVKTLVTRMLQNIYDEHVDTTDLSGKPTEMGHMLDQVDTFLVEAANGARLSVLQEGTHYAFVDDRLAIWLAGTIKALSAFRKTTGDQRFPLTEQALCRIGREKIEAGDTYLVAVSKRIRLDGVQTRCMVFDPKKVPDSMSCEFPRKIASVPKSDFTDSAIKGSFGEN